MKSLRREGPVVEDEKRFGSSFLDDIVGWINDYMRPEQVFDVEYLLDWAKQNSSNIADEFDPDDIFSYKELTKWAEQNGFSSD